LMRVSTINQNVYCVVFRQQLVLWFVSDFNMVLKVIFHLVRGYVNNISL